MAKDLRTFLTEYEKPYPGQVVHIEREVSSKYEVTAFIRAEAGGSGWSRLHTRGDPRGRAAPSHRHPGATGARYGIRLLQILGSCPGVETHLLVTRASKRTVVEKASWRVDRVGARATRASSDRDIGAALASGSFRTCGVVVVPCSIKTLSALVTDYADNLLARAADATLKEGRPLIAMARETPLRRGHLEALAALVRADGVIGPPLPLMSDRSGSVAGAVDQTVGQVFHRRGFPTSSCRIGRGR
jgi:4-hydroxy-3-polyprenylbenzoate decarboxylase